MPLTPVGSDTGDTILADIGSIQYNGIRFSCLNKSRIEARQVLDEAGRTVKYVETKISVDGYVTLTAGAGTNIEATMLKLRQQLSQAGGALTYSLRGYGFFEINGPGAVLRDVAYGPIPNVIEFIPLGMGVGAMIKWEVTTRVAELPNNGAFNVDFTKNLVQFSWGASIAFDEDGYSRISVKGILEVPGNRALPGGREVVNSVDDFREVIFGEIEDDFDLTRFRVTHRTFDISPDKRTMRWELIADEYGPDPLPSCCNSARGSFTARPVNQGAALCPWVCNLRCTYTVRKDLPRRLAYLHFMTLAKFRMECSKLGVVPPADPAPPPPAPPGALIAAGLGFSGIAAGLLKASAAAASKLTGDRKVIPINFEVDEGLYLDSKSVTFQLSWILLCNWQSLIEATGMWRGRGFDPDSERNVYAITMARVSGFRSWLVNRLDIGADVIVDLGGP
jgi:hypothetical protein